MSDKKEKFEAWFVEHNVIAGVPKQYWFELDGEGAYIDDDVFLANRAYQDGAGSMQVENSALLAANRDNKDWFDELKSDFNKANARVAQLEEALSHACYSGLSYEATKLINDARNGASTDTWLADKINDAEVKVLEEAADMLRAYSQDTAATQIENMAESRRIL